MNTLPKLLLLACIPLSACTPPPAPREISFAPSLACTSTMTAVALAREGLPFVTAMSEEEYMEELERKMEVGPAPRVDRSVSIIKIETCDLSWFNKQDYPGNKFAVKIVDKGRVDVFTTSMEGVKAIVDNSFRDVKEDSVQHEQQ